MFWRGRSHHRRGSRAAVKRPALTFAALLAVFLQAFVVQTHVHVVPAPVAAVEVAGATTHAASERASTARDAPALCVICQTMATSGTALLGHAAALIIDTAHADQPREAAQVALQITSHSWQSRAPPTFL
mgnify:CR=1 FL=1